MKILPTMVLACSLAGCSLPTVESELRERGTRFERLVAKEPREVARCIQANAPGQSQIAVVDLRALRNDTANVRVHDSESRSIALFDIEPSAGGRSLAVGWVNAGDMPAAHAAFERYLKGC